MEWPKEVYVSYKDRQFVSEDFRGPEQETNWRDVEEFPDGACLFDARELLALVSEEL